MSPNKIFAPALASVGLTLGLATASAADSVGTFSRIEGNAVVSKGAQYVKAYEGMPLNEGDRLMALDGGKVVLSFKDGCTFDVSDSEILTIGVVSPCASDAVGSYKVDPYRAVSQDSDAASKGFQPAAVGGSSGTVYGASLGWVPAAAAGLVAIAGATDVGGDDNRRTPSP